MIFEQYSVHETYNYRIFYRASNSVIVISLIEDGSRWLDEDSALTGFLAMKKPGCLGLGNALSVLLNITTTDDIVGLSSGYCCTHNRLMWMHRITSDRVHDESPKNGSTSSKGLPSFHKLHAYNTSKPFCHSSVQHMGKEI